MSVALLRNPDAERRAKEKAEAEQVPRDREAAREAARQAAQKKKEAREQEAKEKKAARKKAVKERAALEKAAQRKTMCRLYLRSPLVPYPVPTTVDAAIE